MLAIGHLQHIIIGSHGDVGGGWPLTGDEKLSLAVPPLVWILREARKAGLPLNEDGLLERKYALGDCLDISIEHGTPQPAFHVNGEPADPGPALDREEFSQWIRTASTEGKLHDSVAFGRGVSTISVIGWRMMECLPFKRMDLKPDGTWAPIRWPLPRAEPRDIPREAWIHKSALLRMEADATYRPGNLIVGGGGSGRRTAPRRAGTGEWKVLLQEGDPIGEVMIRAT